MFDVAAKSRRVIPNPVDHYRNVEPPPEYTGGLVSMSFSLFPHSLKPAWGTVR
jgi:hypothetical protein